MRIPSRLLLIVATIVLFTSCDKFERRKADDTAKTTTVEDKSMAEKAGEAGLRARKKAEKIKADEDKKAAETNDAMKE